MAVNLLMFLGLMPSETVPVSHFWLRLGWARLLHWYLMVLGMLSMLIGAAMWFELVTGGTHHVYPSWELAIVTFKHELVPRVGQPRNSKHAVACAAGRTAGRPDGRTDGRT